MLVENVQCTRPGRKRRRPRNACSPTMDSGQGSMNPFLSSRVWGSSIQGRFLKMSRMEQGVGQQTNTARWDGLAGSRHARVSRPKHGPVKRARNQARRSSTAPCIQEVSRPSPLVHRHPRPRNLHCRRPRRPPHPKSLRPHPLRSQNHTLGLVRCTTEPLRG